MKAKLLKKLRKKYSQNYIIYKTIDGYVLRWTDCSSKEFYTTIEEAKARIRSIVRANILNDVYERRGPLKINLW